MKIGMKRMHSANFGFLYRSGMADINNMTTEIINSVVIPQMDIIYSINESIIITYFLFANNDDIGLMFDIILDGIPITVTEPTPNVLGYICR